MKPSLILVVFGVMVGSICCYHGWIATKDLLLSVLPANASSPDTQVAPTSTLRESITFILGDDKEPRNAYYREATLYYSNHPDHRTDYVETSCRSLSEVRQYLLKNAPCNGLPWGLINLVSHGNEWTGLSVKITPDSKRTTSARLSEHIVSGAFSPFPESVLDQKTTIFIHGCGVGNDAPLVDEMAKAFQSVAGLPTVRASRLFEYYASVTHGSRVYAERYLANTWFISYKMGERPAAQLIVNQLREKYPNDSVHWQTALMNSKPRWTGDLYHYTFEVPVKWTIPITNDSISNLLNDTLHQQAWLREQASIMEELAQLNIPFEDFKWSFNKVYVDNEKGEKYPAMWIKGYCTILCVLRPLTEGQDAGFVLPQSFQPDLSNNGFYYTVKADCGM
jgi:hypothetical protein